MLTQMLKELEKIEKFSLQQVAEDLVLKIISNLDSFKTTPVGDIPADMLIFFSYLGFLSRPFTNHRTVGEVGGHFFNSSLLLPPVS